MLNDDVLLSVLLYAELRRSQLDPLQPERGVTGGVIMELNKRAKKANLLCCCPMSTQTSEELSKEKYR